MRCFHFACSGDVKRDERDDIGVFSLCDNNSIARREISQSFASAGDTHLSYGFMPYMCAAEFTSQVKFNDSVYLMRLAYHAYMGFSFQK